VSDSIDYPRLVQGALLGLVRDLLRRVADEGLPGQHHFYLTFRTADPGVALSPRLLVQYPQEMTVALQHQYWGLRVGDESFTVTLKFGGVPETISVPFEALTAFVDPSAQFGLRFGAESGDATPDESLPVEQPAPEEKPERKPRRKKLDADSPFARGQQADEEASRKPTTVVAFRRPGPADGDE
jgi:hypothetical protein